MRGKKEGEFCCDAPKWKNKIHATYHHQKYVNLLYVYYYYFSFFFQQIVDEDTARNV